MPPVQALQLDVKTFEAFDSFVYLGWQVNSIGEEIRWRNTLGNRSYYSIQKLFRSKTPPEM